MMCSSLQVYRSVLLTSRKRRVSGGSDSSKNGGSGSNSPSTIKEEKEKDKKRMDKLTMIRSNSTLPVPQPSSQPPTPTRLAGTGTSFEFEDRGDLIKFYNAVYVKEVKNFALKFSQHNVERGRNMPPLSPLPLVRPHTTSPRRVSTKHCIYISPHKTRATPLTPQSKLLYCFNKSPAKDLRAINNMLRMGERSKGALIAGKRLLQEAAEGQSPAKKLCISLDNNPIGNPLNNRIQEMLQDRQHEASGSV
jgi:retinoblastoma-like protein 2